MAGGSCQVFMLVGGGVDWAVHRLLSHLPADDRQAISLAWPSLTSIDDSFAQLMTGATVTLPWDAVPKSARTPEDAVMLSLSRPVAALRYCYPASVESIPQAGQSSASHVAGPARKGV